MNTTHTTFDDTYRPRDPNHQATPSDSLHDPHTPGSHEGDHHGHVVPLWLLAAVLAVLLFFTFLTVAVTWVDLGGINIWIALLIALVKAMFVAVYFMHLRWDAPFNSLILGAALIFLVLFIGVSLMDTAEYQPTIEEPGLMQVGANPGVDAAVN